MNKAFVINLDSQEELFQEVEQAFLPYGLECERYIVTPDGNKQIGCTITHLDLIAEAKEKNWPYVIVLEDDCTAREAMKDWPALSQFLLQERNRWDIFLGGALYVHPHKLQTGFRAEEMAVIECLRAVTAHFIIYNQSSYEHMLQWHDHPLPPNERPNIDNFFDESTLKIWSSSPGIAWQKPRLGCDWTDDFQHAEEKLHYFSLSLKRCLKYRLLGRWMKEIQ